MTEFAELVSRDGVLMAGRFGPDGRIAEHESTGLYTAYPPALEMAQWFCTAVTTMFNSMALALDTVRYTGFDPTRWLPQKGWAFYGRDYSIAVYGDRFVLAENEQIGSFDELWRMLGREAT